MARHFSAGAWRTANIAYERGGDFGMSGEGRSRDKDYCVDLLRQRRTRRRLLAENLGTEDPQQAASANDLVLLQQLLTEAEDEPGRAVIYVYMDGMSHEQAAVVLGVAKRTVGNLVDRFLTWARQRSSDKKIKLAQTNPAARQRVGRAAKLAYVAARQALAESGLARTRGGKSRQQQFPG